MICACIQNRVKGRTSPELKIRLHLQDVNGHNVYGPQTFEEAEVAGDTIKYKRYTYRYR